VIDGLAHGFVSALQLFAGGFLGIRCEMFRAFACLGSEMLCAPRQARLARSVNGSQQDATRQCQVLEQLIPPGLPPFLGADISTAPIHEGVQG
jgi:hypothetical protein